MAVALYARVSTVKQADKDLSIPDQLRQMQDWCESQGYLIGETYIEAGASATDDRRPVFQAMIAEATKTPAPFEAIIVHSLSRFFRDSLEFALYERKLKRAGVKLISITQQTSDDPSGEMARKIFSIFDEYQSKENGKHTLRAMKENARQGFWNGSRPPFGYKTVEAEKLGNKGKRKQRLAIDPAESAQVRQIFGLYLNGKGHGPMGAKQIASYLNETGRKHRNSSWTRSRVHEVLSNATYVGDYYFNRMENKTRRLKPESEWILLKVDPIIDVQTFQAVKSRKASRAFDQVPVRTLTSETLLTGMIKCGCCGAGMTTATGKGGQYRYYKCNTRIAKHIKQCSNPAVPMDKMDAAVLDALAEKLFTPERVKQILMQLQKQIKATQERDAQGVKALQAELSELQQASERLFEAVEKGILPLDELLQQRSRRLQTRRQEVLTEIASHKRRADMPAIRPRQVELFCKALNEKLHDRDSGFAKAYLRQIIGEIRVTGNEAVVTGNSLALAMSVAETKKGTSVEVPKSVFGWLPDLGSNQGPTD
ncbi:MAG: recombinase family protein, partial [Kiritimatiellia bacterium]